MRRSQGIFVSASCGFLHLNLSLNIGAIPLQRDSIPEPKSDSRYLYAGCRPSSKQVPLELILEIDKPSRFDIIHSFRHLRSSSLALASLILT